MAGLQTIQCSMMMWLGTGLKGSLSCLDPLSVFQNAVTQVATGSC